jgi:excinuclease UvrABC nuclease subunit
MFFQVQIDFHPKWLQPYLMSSVSLVPLCEFHENEFPDDPGLYFVLCKNKNEDEWWYYDGLTGHHFGYKILYIGKANSLRDRWWKHHRLSQFEAYGHEYGFRNVKIAYKTYSYEFRDLSKECINMLLLRMERECIEYFSPILNGTPVKS